ncbi:MAG: polymer-forming cytoskeletal protein [Bacteroidales bacterium]|nr:polymer-forming cytoskeletal protein [Bacteroidales bacterium]
MARMSESEITTINTISNGTIIKGDVTANGDFRLDGQLDGDVTINGRLVVGDSGLINGNVVCQNAIIMGQVTGNISVKELLSLNSTAKVKGDILINQIAIEPGASFSGTCRMIDEVRREAQTEQQDNE